MVSGAQHTGQQPREHYVTDQQQIHDLLKAGAGPVVTGGQNSSVPTALSLAGQEVARIYQTGGTWELVRDGQEWFFHTDTPGIRLELPSLPGTVWVTAVTVDVSRSQIVSQPLIYPDKAILVKISPTEGVESTDE